jgi:hypothetical protein
MLTDLPTPGDSRSHRFSTTAYALIPLAGSVWGREEEFAVISAARFILRRNR